MHMETRFLDLTDDDGRGVRIRCKKAPFTFNVSPYSNETLRKAKHIEDLKHEKNTFLNIDGFVRGTGTASCGPAVLSKYDLRMKDELEFEFCIAPLK